MTPALSLRCPASSQNPDDLSRQFLLTGKLLQNQSQKKRAADFSAALTSFRRRRLLQSANYFSAPRVTSAESLAMN